MLPCCKQNYTIVANRKVLVFYFLLCFIEHAFAEQWYYSPVPRGRHINAVNILDSLHIVIGGGSESNDSLKDVFLSVNKGLSWGSSSNARSPWIKSIAFSDALHGLAVGYTGTLQKTTDGAVSWADIRAPINRQFNNVFFQNAQTAFIVGGSIPRTDTLQTILKSTDSGKTWNILRDQRGYWLRGIYFTNSNNGIAVGDNGTILKTTNGGQNWTVITPPVSRDLRAVEFINDTVGYIVGGKNYFDVIDSFRTILRTTNGGTNWTVLKDDSAAILTDICFINDRTGYICGDKATLLKTTDGGLNWSSVPIPNSQPNDYFNSVDFYNDLLGIVGGLNGQTYIYTSSQLPDVYSLPAEFADTANYILHGGVHTHGEAALYTFYFSIDSTFTSNPFDLPENVKSNFIKPVKYILNGLIPDTTYHYYLEAKTFAGKVRGDTLSFTSARPDFIFMTQPATEVSSFSATLNGKIEKFPYNANIRFEWGQTPSFGNEIPAVPSSVNDTFLHTFSANLNGLQPDAVYFFRLKTEHNSEIYYGNTLSFYTSRAYLQTLPASIITDSTALLSGSINKFLVPVKISFEYGRTIALENEIKATPSTNTDSMPHNVFALVKNLIPSTQYLFRFKGQTDFSDYYGSILSFMTGINYGKFETGDATSITNTSARLHGLVSKMYDSIQLAFEYGTTPSFGHSIASVPFVITDSTEYDITATITGLLTDQLYYYRLKGTIHGMTIYGKTRQFFTGESDIPNWDFQFWDIDTIQVPATWSFFGENFQQVSGHTGNYGLKLFNQSVGLNGMISDGKDGDLVNGVAISVGSPPDSVSFYLNYAVESGDTAIALFQMKKQGRLLFRNFYPVTGNSNGEFKRLSYKILYDTLAVPDSLAFGFITTNILTHPPGPFHNNSLTIDDVASQPGNIGFENSDFEDWYSSVLEIPVSWFNLRYFGLIRDYPDSNHMVNRVFFKTPDDYAAEIKNVHIPSWGVAQGAISNQRAVIDDRKIGFPVKGRHVTLNGYYKFFPLPGDTLETYIDMKKNGINIGNTIYFMADTVSEFTPFTIPLYYNNDTDIPDSAYIEFRINNITPSYGSRLILDKLSFDGSVTAVMPPAELLEVDGIKVYPNPTRDYIIIENAVGIRNESSLAVWGISGQLIQEVKLTPGKQTAQMEVGNLKPGIYLISIRNGEKTFSQKIIIQ